MKNDKSEFLLYKSVLFDNELFLPVYLLKIENIREFIENQFQVAVLTVVLDGEYEKLNGWELFDSKRHLLSMVLKKNAKHNHNSLLSIFAVRSGTFIIFYPFKEESEFESYINLVKNDIEEYCNVEMFDDKFVEYAYEYLPLNQHIRIERLVETSIFRCLNKINNLRKKDYEKWEKSLINLLDEENIVVHFQPILNINDNTLLAIELLSRTNLSYFSNTELLFNINSNYKYYNELESLCFRKINDIIRDKKRNIKYSVNFSSDYILNHLLNDENLREIIKRKTLMPSDFIIEITERNQVVNTLGFKRVLKELKNFGFKIAIDDVGSGYSTLGMISEINPDYIKYDLKLIRDIDKIPIKRELLKSIINFAHEQKLILIAEGVETKEEYETIKQLGVEYAQGYFFQKPTTDLDMLVEKYAAED